MINLVGRQIDNYRVDALLGEGGMGAVYRAHDLNLDRDVALKVMHPQFAKQPEFQKRFLQEAQAAAKLGDHPSIVNIYNFGSRQGFFYMLMAFVPGASLGKYIKRLQQQNQVVKLSETLLILAQVSEALGYAHRHGVVHRDIKPDNVLLKPREEPIEDGRLPVRAVVTDFGLAKLLEGGVQTQTGTFMGTLPYMSPEQCMNKELDGRSDLYSLGIMLYQLATGQLPFDIKSPTEAVMKHINEIPPRPEVIRPGLPPEVASVIEKSIAKDPGDRYQSGEDMAAALRQAAAGLTDADVTKFAPQETVVSIATQLLPAETVAEPSQVGFELTALPGEARVLIARKGEEPRSHPLDKNLITIGRSSGNDITLVAEGISRQHARIEQASLGTWQVVDTGSTNGTFLEDNRLLPDLPEVLEAGKVLRIGPYFLRLQEAEGAAIAGAGAAAGLAAYSMQATARASVPIGGTQVHSSTGQLSVVVQPTNVVVSPGGRADVQVELLNQGATVDHFQLESEGLPQEWVSIPQDSVQLMPGNNGALPLTIHPPLDSSAEAGQHPYRLTVRSTSNLQESASVSGQVTVKPFERFTIDMRPKRLRNGGVSRILVRNEGNAEATYNVIGRDPAEEVNFEKHQGRLRLAAGDKGTVDLQLKAKSRPFIGSSKVLPFEVAVGTVSGDRQTLPGQLDVRPIIPLWLIPLFLALMMILCLTGGGLFAFFNDRNDKATQTAVALVEGQLAAQMTQEALLTIAAQETALFSEGQAATGTALAATAQAEGDDDADGLSNNQELSEGTDPNNPDTDGDGLNDGQEVNQHGTNPKQQDSDGDTLIDGAEVNDHGTSPTNPDTDGDGVPDGVEVSSGTDPKLPPTATPLPTDTPPATHTTTPTNTPSATPTQVATPTPTFTPSPTVTPTPGFALRFDGTDDFVSVVNGGDFDFNNEFTVEAWIHPTSLVSGGSFGAIVQGANSEPPFSGGAWVLFLDSADHSDWGLSVCVPGCNAADSGVGNLQTNEWQHVAGVYDGSNITIYRNGQLVDNIPHSGNVSDPNFVLFGIWNRSFRGTMDEVRVWDVALSQSAIDDNRNNLLAGDEHGLVGYWRFDEGSGQVAGDSSGNNNNGKLGALPAADGNDPQWVVSDAPVN
jgi:serine/threonine protein kinase